MPPTSPTSCARGTELGGTTYKVHLDGHDQLAYITGETDESPRKHFFYVSDDGDLTALRFDNWKFVFMEQRCPGTLQIWAEPFTELRVPKIFNLRTDPYERADITSNTYYDWLLDHAFMFIPAQAYVAADAADVRRVPAAAEVGQLQPRPGDGEAAGRLPRATKSSARRTWKPRPICLYVPGRAGALSRSSAEGERLTPDESHPYPDPLRRAAHFTVPVRRTLEISRRRRPAEENWAPSRPR